MRTLAIALLLAGTAAAAPVVLELACPPRVSYRVYRDLDHDGMEDLMVVGEEEAWLWRGKRRLAPEPDAKFRMPPGAALFDVEQARSFRQPAILRRADRHLTTGISLDIDPAASTNLLWSDA